MMQRSSVSWGLTPPPIPSALFNPWSAGRARTHLRWPISSSPGPKLIGRSSSSVIVLVLPSLSLAEPVEV
jgi:hypothetical protein